MANSTIFFLQLIVLVFVMAIMGQTVDGVV